MARHSHHQVPPTRRKGSPLLTVIFCVALAVFLGAGYMLVSQLLEYHRGEKEYGQMVELVGDVVSEENEQALLEEDTAEALIQSETYIESWRVKMAELTATNEDLVGWIWIPDTEINYPIVQGEDNNYYLKRTFNGQRNANGSIFMDYRNAADFLDANTVLHGHHMRNGTMFAGLVDFQKQAFVDEHPFVYIVMPDGRVERYGIYACYVTEADSQYTRVNFDDAEEHQDYVDWTLKNSLIHTPYTADVNSHILTLSTCAYNYDSARCTVQAVLLDSAGNVEALQPAGE